jgi:predicted regulator of Ras-like GTPase activity (Roadblock/LC7/MglB family)
MTPFTHILERAVKRVPGAVGAIFVASDGEAVDQYVVNGGEDMLVLGAHYGIVLNHVQSAMHLFHFGEAEEMILQHGRLDLILRTVAEGYFVVLAVATGNQLAFALREAGAAASALRAEM